MSESHHSRKMPRFETYAGPVLKIYVWRCSEKDCRSDNETLATESVRGNRHSEYLHGREPFFFGEKCEKCRVRATALTCLLEIKMRQVQHYVKRKEPVEDDNKMTDV
jgi:hypothetical protein